MAGAGIELLILHQGSQLIQTDYLQYYDQEKYLFEVVSERYKKNQTLSAFDFFCIVIWKANRAKSKIAKRLLDPKYNCRDLDTAVSVLLRDISDKDTPKERLAVLIETWGFSLPMASAILTVLFPNEFSIYDVRVCNELKGFFDVKNKTNFDHLWEGYLEYMGALKKITPSHLGLRDKDRFLWAKSFADQLQNDVNTCFSKPT